MVTASFQLYRRKAIGDYASRPKSAPGEFQKWIAPSWVVRAFRPAFSTLPIPRCWNRSKHSTRSARPEQSRHQVIAVIPQGVTADYIRLRRSSQPQHKEGL